MTMIPAFGGYLYSSIFASLYEVQSQGLCKGTKCFEETFDFCFVSCCVCVGVNVFLLFRKRNHS
jgi:hypothetical protein